MIGSSNSMKPEDNLARRNGTPNSNMGINNFLMNKKTNFSSDIRTGTSHNRASVGGFGAVGSTNGGMSTSPDMLTDGNERTSLK